MSSSGIILGIDLGGTKIRSMSFEQDLTELREDYRETEAHEGPEAIIDRMVESALAAADGRPIIAAGISTPGPSKPKEGIVTEPPNLPGWRNVPLARLITERLGVPAWLENDANCAALAEHRTGAGKGLQHVILVTLGTGVGGGLILNDRLYQGASGAAGEIGHMLVQPGGPLCGCGRAGCLEAMASGIAFAREAAGIIEKSPNGILARLVYDSGEEPDAKLLQQAANEGDEEADLAIRTGGRYLGAGLTNLVNVFNPDMIVLGGSLVRMGDRYLGEAMMVLERDAFAQPFADVQVVLANLGDEAPVVGAALIAMENLKLVPGGA